MQTWFLRDWFLGACLIAALGPQAFGGTVVAPNGIANGNAAGNSSGPLPTTPVSVESQTVINPGQFPSRVITITGFSYRAAPGTGALNIPFTGSIYLSTSPNFANSTGHPLLSTTFASNVGPDNTLVFSGSGVVTGPACAAPGPCPFGDTMTFTTPFLYNPANGPLLIDLQLTSVGGPTTSGRFDVFDCDPMACSINGNSASPLGSSTGTLNSGDNITQIAFTTPATQFVPVNPCRIADTRNAAGAFGGPAIAAGTFRTIQIPAAACGIPPNAVAFSLNVAVVPRGTLGFLTLWPSGTVRPLVATLNSIDGRIKSNAAIVPAGSIGAVALFATNTTDVILDINGYFVANSPSALAFYPVTPCRIADTRNATAPLGGPSLPAGSTRSFPIQASSCGVPASAQAYSLNFAAVPKGTTLGFMTAWPDGVTRPLVASLNDPTGTVAANAVVVPAGAGGAVNVFTTDATDLVIDINGYFAPPGPGGLRLYTLDPCRVLDSRLPAGTPPFSTAKDVNVTAAPCGAPAAAQAFVFNATLVPPGLLGFITMWPQGQSQPLAATLNAYDGAITNNMAIVPTTTGSISVSPSAPTHLVLDIFGYFAP